MKTKLFPMYLILLVSLYFSCSSDTIPEKSKIEPPEVENNHFTYIVLRNDGQLFEIDNLSGTVTPTSKIADLDFNVLLNGITASEEKIYLYEHEFDPFQGFIHIYDKTSGKSEVNPIHLPEEVFGENAGLVSLDWDEEKNSLVALVVKEYETNFYFEATLARINPETFEVTPLPITVNQGPVKSTVLVNSQLFISTFKSFDEMGENQFFKIDLGSHDFIDLDIEGIELPPLHLSANDAGNKIFGFIPVPNSTFAGATEPVVIDLTNLSSKYLLPQEETGIKTVFGKSFYNTISNEFVDIITSATYIGILQYNSETGALLNTHLEFPNDLSSFSSIIGVKAL